ncbi:MAG: 50S ribosomal protein L24 [Patescibacteria group bacterium]
MKIKTGDNVRVLAGKHKGKEGKVLQTFPAKHLVVIEGINMATKHIKAKGKGAVGQRVTFNAPMPASRVAVVANGEKGRVGYAFTTKDGKTKKVRVLRTKKGVSEIG